MFKSEAHKDVNYTRLLPPFPLSLRVLTPYFYTVVSAGLTARFLQAAKVHRELKLHLEVISFLTYEAEFIKKYNNYSKARIGYSFIELWFLQRNTLKLGTINKPAIYKSCA